MKTARLETLDIEVLLLENEEFHDDGFVKSIRDYQIQLKQRYYSYHPTEKELEKPTFGICGEMYNGSNVYYHIAYKDQEDNFLNLQTRAHEETHVLWHLNKLNLLEEKITQNLRITIDLSAMKDFGESELIAEIGGIYPLQKIGFSLRTISHLRDENFHEAVEIYEKAIQKNLNPPNA